MSVPPVVDSITGSATMGTEPASSARRLDTALTAREVYIIPTATPDTSKSDSTASSCDSSILWETGSAPANEDVFWDVTAVTTDSP